MLLIDDGFMGGSDQIPYENLEQRNACNDLYERYFLHDDENNPRNWCDGWENFN